MSDLEIEYEKKHREFLELLIPIIRDKVNLEVLHKLSYTCKSTTLEMNYPDLQRASHNFYGALRDFENEQVEIRQLQRLLQKHGDKFKNGEIVL